MKTKTCCLCGKEYEGYGNNAEPIASGECCDECNMYKVIPARIEQNLCRMHRSVQMTA